MIAPKVFRHIRVVFVAIWLNVILLILTLSTLTVIGSQFIENITLPAPTPNSLFDVTASSRNIVDENIDRLSQTLVDPESAPRDLLTGNMAVLSVVISSLRPQDQVFHAWVQVGVGYAMLTNLVDAANGTPIIDPNSNGPFSPKLLPQYNNLPVIVTIGGYNPAFEVRVPLTLSDIIASDTSVESSLSPFYSRMFPIDIPAIWHENLYPQDVLYSFATASIEWPANIVGKAQYACTIKTTTGCYPSLGIYPFWLTLRVMLVDSRVASGWNPRFAVVPGISSMGPNSMPLAITCTRDALSLWFVYGTAGVPFGLFVLLLQTLFLRRKTIASDKPSSLQEFILSLAAAMFTIVPLRAVLVPQSVDVITSLDLILGAEMLLLLALGIGLQGWYLVMRTWSTTGNGVTQASEL